MLTLGIEAFRYAEGGLLPKWEGSFLEAILPRYHFRDKDRKLSLLDVRLPSRISFFITGVDTR